MNYEMFKSVTKISQKNTIIFGIKYKVQSTKTKYSVMNMYEAKYSDHTFNVKYHYQVSCFAALVIMFLHINFYIAAFSASVTFMKL